MANIKSCCLCHAGVRHFGKDFQAISQMLGSKNTTQVRAFFSSYRKRYNLDGALADYEANKILLGGEVEPVSIEMTVSDILNVFHGTKGLDQNYIC